MRQLLDQTSGLADRQVPDLSRPGGQERRRGHHEPELSASRRQAGQAFNYHNPNYQVAARLVEVVSGQPFDSYLWEHVFRPAGMAASLTTYTDDEPVDGLGRRTRDRLRGPDPRPRSGHLRGWVR